MSLAGLRVLVTRPHGRADDLCAAIHADGGAPVHIPLLAVIALDAERDVALWQQTQRRILDLDRYRRVIAISVNAVHYGLNWIANYWPQLPLGIDWYGIGAATIAEFARWHIDARGGQQSATSEALLALPELHKIAGERLLILRGVGGRETLASELRARGAQVDYAECYRRCAPTLTAQQQLQLQQAAFDAVCVNSAETLLNLWQLIASAPTHYRRLPLIVPSERVAQQARTLGFTQVLVAANAGTAATLVALRAIKD